MKKVNHFSQSFKFRLISEAKQLDAPKLTFFPQLPQQLSHPSLVCHL